MTGIRVTRLPQLGVLRVAGDDRLSFLQGQLTQDLHQVAGGRSLLAGWNSPKGRLLALGQLLGTDDSVLIIMPAELLEATSTRLRRFVLRAAVTIDLPEAGIWGLLDLAEDQPVKVAGVTLPPAEGACASGNGLFLARAAGDPGRALLISLSGKLPAEAQAAGWTEAEPGDWQLAEIRSGIPQVTAANAEAFVPQMVNLDLLGGISFRKGCYVGQEIVARTQNLGRIKRRMFHYRAATPDDTQAGAGLHDANGENVGRVVSNAAASDGCELLAVVSLSAANESLFTASGQPLEPLALPYAIPAED